MKPEAPPSHLTAATAAWWTQVTTDYALESHHLKMLTLACEAFDRATEARELLAKEGIVVEDRFGAPRPHPAVSIERDARLAFVRIVRELDLDGEPLPDPRPSRLPRNR